MRYIQKGVYFHAGSVSALAHEISRREMNPQFDDEPPIISISIVQDREGGYSCIGLTARFDKDATP